jgi:predicted transcriptional regulator
MLADVPDRGAPVKTMTLRLDDERAATLELIARAEDKTMTDAVRAAIDALIEDRRKDKAFMERLRERHERERALYERLAK